MNRSVDLPPENGSPRGSAAVGPIDDEVAFTVSAQVTVELEIDHLHDDARAVPMIEQRELADVGADGSMTRVVYACPDCGQRVGVTAVGRAHRPLSVELGPAESTAATG